MLETSEGRVATALQARRLGLNRRGQEEVATDHEIARYALDSMHDGATITQ